MEYLKQPKQLGEIMREHFIIDDNDIIDHDMIVTLFNIADPPPESGDW